MKKLLVTAALISIPAPAFADDAQVAKDMLVKAHAAIKADRELGLIQIQKGENGFRVGDIYPYCYRLPDGKALSGPVAVLAGTDTRTLKDAAGKPFGLEQYEATTKNPEGVMTEINYTFPKPGTKEPSFPKVSFVMKVAPDLGCGVGYYK